VNVNAILHQSNIDSICKVFIESAHEEFTISDSGNDLDCDNACSHCIFGFCYDMGYPGTNVGDSICLKADCLSDIKKAAPWKFL